MVGILRCKDCGSYMRPKNSGNKKKDGTISYYYSCVLKEKSRKIKCNSKNVKGDFIDNEILNALKNIFKKLSQHICTMSFPDSGFHPIYHLIQRKKASLFVTDNNIFRYTPPETLSVLMYTEIPSHFLQRPEFPALFANSGYLFPCDPHSFPGPPASGA